MKTLCEYLREHTMNIINFKRKKMSFNKRAAGIIYKNTKICYKKFCKEKFENKYVKDKTYHKFRDHCHHTGEYRADAYVKCNLKYSVHRKIPIVFYNGSNYDFIIKELAEEFKKQFTCLGEILKNI